MSLNPWEQLTENDVVNVKSNGAGYLNTIITIILSVYATLYVLDHPAILDFMTIWK